MSVALLLGEELVDDGEHHAAAGDRELGAQVGAVGGLHRRLPQQVAAAGERAEELVVEVVAVGDHDDRRVRHPRVEDDPPRVERHRQALARALSVPDNANPPVAGVAARPLPGLVPTQRLRYPSRRDCLGRTQGLFNGHVHGVELVVTRHLLDERGAAPIGRRILEHDEVPQQVEKAALLEDTLQHDL